MTSCHIKFEILILVKEDFCLGELKIKILKKIEFKTDF